MKQRIRHFLLPFLLLLQVLPSLHAWAGELRALTVLHTNDLHGMLLPFDDKGHPEESVPAEKNVGGLARRAALIARIRAATDHPVLVVDTGDIFTRGPWHKRFYGTPEIESMNLMKLDFFAVGNNEFKAVSSRNGAQRIFLSLLKKSHFPWLCANLTDAKTNLPVNGIRPYVIHSAGGLRIGVFGLTTPRASSYRQIQGWRIGDPVETARKLVPLIRKEADIVLALTHLGVDAWDERLAREVPGIDAIVSGDSHVFLSVPDAITAPDNAPDHAKIPLVQAGEKGIRLGRLDLIFEKSEQKTDRPWRLKSFKGALLPVDRALPEDPAVKSYLDRALTDAYY